MYDIISKFKEMKDGLDVTDREDNLLHVTFSINPPAKREDVEFFEKQSGFVLPESYKNFLYVCNGGKFFNYEDLGGFRFFKISEIKAEIDEMEEIYEEDWDKSIVPFARYIGEGNHLAFKFVLSTNKYEIVDCFHEADPVDWETISDDFGAFFDKLMSEDGTPFWLYK
jgi:hypothetical protein